LAVGQAAGASPFGSDARANTLLASGAGADEVVDIGESDEDPTADLVGRELAGPDQSLERARREARIPRRRTQGSIGRNDRLDLDRRHVGFPPRRMVTTRALSWAGCSWSQMNPYDPRWPLHQRPRRRRQLFQAGRKPLCR